jgi:hypothetical protein
VTAGCVDRPGSDRWVDTDTVAPLSLTASPCAIGGVPYLDGLRMVDVLKTVAQAEVARLAGVALAILDALQRQWRSTGSAPAADAAAQLATAARQLRAQSQLAGPATITATPPHSTTHVLTLNATDQDLAGHAVERHLTGLAEHQHRTGAVDRGVPDLPSTPVNEHEDAMTSSRRQATAAATTPRKGHSR